MAKISIIIPVYNVERYLEKCIDSILQQTFKDIEVVLVNDGSQDQCGEICDRYKQKDNRIKVVHKENGGVASARNAGLKIATGEWIGWVDADDWIEPDMFNYLIENAIVYGADIAACGRWEEYGNESRFRGWKSAKLLNTVQALELLLENDAFQNYLWDKLWKRELFKKIVFPEGRTFEDVSVVYQLVSKAKSVICLPKGQYHYLQRKNSIVNDSSLINKINYYKAINERHEFILEKFPHLSEKSTGEIATAAVRIWGAYYDNQRSQRKIFRSHLKEISVFMSSVDFSAADDQLGIAGRIILRLTPYAAWWSFAGAKFFDFLYQKRHRRFL